MCVCVRAHQTITDAGWAPLPDSYWIIRGLLASGLAQSATKMVLNLMHTVDLFGFVPNGTRTYYNNRR